MQKCIICLETNVESFEGFNKVFYRCSKCEFISLGYQYVVSTENEKQRYLKHNNSCDNEGYVNMFNNFIDSCIKPYIKFKGANVLDFGCGSVPVLAELLNSKGAITDYYDIYFYPEKGFRNKMYDAILLTEVIEHLHNPLEVIFFLVQRLKSNGIIALTTMFHSNIINEFTNWWYIRDETHISFFSKKTMQFVAEKCNLNIIMTSGDNYCVFQKR